MGKIPSSESINNSAGQKVTHILWKPKFNYGFHKRPL